MKLINIFYILLTIVCTQLYAADNNIPECYINLFNPYCSEITLGKSAAEIKNTLITMNNAQPLMIDLIKAVSNPNIDPTEFGRISAKAFFYCAFSEIILLKKSQGTSVNKQSQLFKNFLNIEFSTYSNELALINLKNIREIQKAGGKEEKDAKVIYNAYMQYLNDKAQKTLDEKNKAADSLNHELM